MIALLINFVPLKNLFSATSNIPLKIGVNRFAWHASLQNINFMPLVAADPFAGVILTDWYSINDSERYKIDIYILEELLTSQTIQVKLFKQKKNGSSWVDVPANNIMAQQIQDNILNTARQLRIQDSLK
ncbi:DUF3576 domain-containing protein [Candidatus Hepatincolaceae symbiont of Richtersius coronifer]